GAYGAHDPGCGGEGGARRSRPGRQDHRPCPARRRDGGYLHRPPPDPRAGGRDRHPGGRRRHRRLDPLRRPHDPRPQDSGPPQGERGRGHPRLCRRHHPQGGHPEAQGARGRRDLYPGNADEAGRRVRRRGGWV
ncbi:MAG: B12 binding domain of Methylmalonyl-CoA mutase, partial [uncultured Rubrobacteraceae bacterium]